MHDRAGQTAQRPRGLCRVGIVGVGPRADRLEAVGGLPQRQDAGVGSDADEGIGGGGPTGDHSSGQSAVRVTVGHAVAGLIDEVAARLGGDPRRPVDPGVDHSNSYPGSRCEPLRVGQPQVVAGPRPISEVGIGKDCGRSAHPALLHRLIRTGLIRRDRGWIDDGRFDRLCGRRCQQNDQQ